MGNAQIALLARFAPFFRTGFLAWLAENGHLYDAFEQRALAYVATGKTHFSARTIVQEMRDVLGLAERGGGEGYRINGNHAPDLARVFAILHPPLARLWEYRRSDSDAFLHAVTGRPPEPPQRDLFA